MVIACYKTAHYKTVPYWTQQYNSDLELTTDTTELTYLHLDKMAAISHTIFPMLFTWGQFWPSGIVIAPVCVSVSVCVYVCVCINHLLVRTITHQPFKLKSPNLKHRCKTPWLRCLLFWGVIDLELQGQIERESRILPHFELVRTITCHPFKLESPNLDKKCILVQLRCLLV